MTEYRAVEFISGMITGTTGAKNVQKVLAQNEGWIPILFCDGPHMLAPVMVFKKD